MLYRDEGSSDLTLGALNLLPGASANLSAEPLLTATWRLTPSSPCRNAGTATQAPLRDIDGQNRPNEGAFDVGFDEFYP